MTNNTWKEIKNIVLNIADKGVYIKSALEAVECKDIDALQTAIEIYIRPYGLEEAETLEDILMRGNC